MGPSAYQQCLHAALRLLGRRDHSRAELAGKLRQKGFEAATTERVLSECERLSYLNDVRFCRSYTTHLRRRGYGALRIAQLLRAKGLTGEQVARSLHDHCGDLSQMEDCRRVLVKKLGREPSSSDTIAVKTRLFRFLCQRGFTSAVVSQVIHDWLADRPTADR